MNRSIFFLPGFEPRQIAEIIGREAQNKKRLNKIKERKRQERKTINKAKYKVGEQHE